MDVTVLAQELLKDYGRYHFQEGDSLSGTLVVPQGSYLTSAGKRIPFTGTGAAIQLLGETSISDPTIIRDLVLSGNGQGDGFIVNTPHFVFDNVTAGNPLSNTSVSVANGYDFVNAFTVDFAHAGGSVGMDQFRHCQAANYKTRGFNLLSGNDLVVSKCKAVSGVRVTDGVKNIPQCAIYCAVNSSVEGCHFWGNHDTMGFFASDKNFITDCQFEGAYGAQILLAGSKNVVRGGSVFLNVPLTDLIYYPQALGIQIGMTHGTPGGLLDTGSGGWSSFNDIEGVFIGDPSTTHDTADRTFPMGSVAYVRGEFNKVDLKIPDALGSQLLGVVSQGDDISIKSWHGIQMIWLPLPTGKL